MTRPVPTMRGQVRVRNVYRDDALIAVWHPSRLHAEASANFVERNTDHRLAYRVVACFK